MNSFLKTFRWCSVYRLIPVFVCVVLLQSTVSSSALHALEAGMQAPDFSLSDLSGSTKNFNSLKGEKLTLLVFWATWGSNSPKALQQAQRLYEKYKAAGLSVVGINVDNQEVTEASLLKVREAVAEQKITFPILVDPGLKAFGSYGVIAVPSTLVLDRDRIIRHEKSGFPLVGAAEQRQFVEAILENRPLVVAQSVNAGYQPDKKAVRLWNMGVSTQRSERTAPKAKAWFEQAIAADPAFVLPYISLGELYRKEHNLEEARKQFEAALRHKPDHPVALSSLGQVLLQQGDLTSAEKTLNLAVKADEGYLPTLCALGLLKGRQGDIVLSKQWFDRAEQLNPRDYRIYKYRALVSEERHDLPAAAAEYKRALQLIIGQK